jgi:hypothetical protein
MIPTERASPAKKSALLLSLIVLACLSAGAVSAAAETTIHFTKESLQAFEHQMAVSEIQAATFNKRVRSLHLTLKNGQHVLVHYGPGEQKKLQEELTAKSIPVTVLKPAQAQKEAAKTPVHHKLRYIAGGILIAVVIIVAAVLFYDRKRKRAAE